MDSSLTTLERGADPDPDARLIVPDEHTHTRFPRRQHDEENGGQGPIGLEGDGLDVVCGRAPGTSQLDDSQREASPDINLRRARFALDDGRCSQVLDRSPQRTLAKTSSKAHARRSADTNGLNDASYGPQEQKAESLPQCLEAGHDFQPECGYSSRARRRLESPKPSPRWLSSASSPTGTHHTYQVARKAVFPLTIILGGAAAITIVNYSQAHGACPASENDHRWFMALDAMQHLPESIRCPSTLLASLGFGLYSLVGILHIPWAPRYWPDCGLVAITISVLTGTWVGLEAMVNALVIAGLISLVVAKGLEWLPRRQSPYRPPLLSSSNRDGKDLRLASTLTEDLGGPQTQKS